MPERSKPLSTSKVMDVTHPSQARPSTTSRPVIVSNRPMIPEDPMINQAAQSAIDREKPSGVPEISEAPKTPVLQVSKGKTIIPPGQSESPQSIITKPADDVPRDETVQPVSSDQISKPAQTVDTSVIAKEPTAPKEKEPREKPVALSFGAMPLKTEETIGFSSELKDGHVDEGNKEVKEKTREDERHEEIEEIIASGKYHVPIGEAAKRRGRKVLAIILVVLLLLVLADVVLDMDLLSIAGVPHTNFL